MATQEIDLESELIAEVGETALNLLAYAQRFYPWGEGELANASGPRRVAGEDSCLHSRPSPKQADAIPAVPNQRGLRQGHREVSEAIVKSDRAISNNEDRALPPGRPLDREVNPRKTSA